MTSQKNTLVRAMALIGLLAYLILWHGEDGGGDLLVGSQDETRRSLKQRQDLLVPPLPAADGSFALGESDVAALERVDSPPDPTSSPPPLFLHIYKAGGSSVITFMRQCFGLKLTFIFRDKKAKKMVNKQGVFPNRTDVLVGNIAEGTRNVYSPNFKGRVFTILRHPVDMAVSHYHYVQVAFWEQSYNPEVRDIPIEEFVMKQDMDNKVVRRLLNKQGNTPLGKEDLERSKAILRDHVLVGLVHKMGESLDRFDKYFGFSRMGKKNKNAAEMQQCKDGFYGKTGKKESRRMNKNKHPDLDPESETWKEIAARHSLDLQLYEYALELFEEQSKLFD